VGDTFTPSIPEYRESEGEPPARGGGLLDWNPRKLDKTISKAWEGMELDIEGKDLHDASVGRHIQR